MSSVCYTDIDANACAWMGELVQQGHLATGRVLHADIKNITPGDADGYDRVHFFAGIGGWELACRLAGWPDELRLWSASLPCQPFSTAGKQLGTDDERHLWPIFRDLVEQCLPPVIVGEQVASKAGREWLATVRTDLEALGYAVGAADLCAAGVGAPHLRQRLYWCAVDARPIWEPFSCCEEFWCNVHLQHAFECECPDVETWEERTGLWPYDLPVWLAHTQFKGLERFTRASNDRSKPGRINQKSPRSTTESSWADAEYFDCLDGKARPIPTEPGLFPLANGLPRGVVPSGDISRALEEGTSEARVMRLRGYGNAIVPQVAAEFLGAFLVELGGEL